MSDKDDELERLRERELSHQVIIEDHLMPEIRRLRAEVKRLEGERDFARLAALDLLTMWDETHGYAGPYPTIRGWVPKGKR